ncbi:LamG-like jellyroll fold domain-containing protein [Enterobacter hormaechei]
MSQFTEGDSAVNRLNAAVSAFEKVLTEPEGTVVEMPIGAAQPSLAERLKRALDAVTVKPAQAASQATAAAQQAQVAQQAAAQSAADAANSAAATGYVDAPFPDVWAPLNDDLRLLAGFAPADTITVGGTSYPLKTKSISFNRASTATYIDKSGVLQTAAINEPRFEKEGLLIEQQSTNLLKWSSPTAAANEFRFGAGVSVAYLPSGGVEVTKIADSGSWFEQNTGATNYDPAAPASCSAYLTIPDGASVSFVFMTYNATDGDKSVLSAPGVNGRNTLSLAVVGGTASQRLAARLTFPVGFPIGGKVVMDRMQIEPLAVTTSYIPTAGASVTRAADDCTLQRSGNDNYFGSVTIAAEVQCNGKTLADGQTGSRRGILAIYPTTNDYCLVFVNSATNAAGVVTFSYGDPGQKANNEIIDDGKPHIVSVRSNGLQKDICIDGSLSGSATVTKPTPGSVASYSNIIMIGRGAGANGAGLRMLNGHIRNLRIWHRALSDIQIKGLR